MSTRSPGTSGSVRAVAIVPAAGSAERFGGAKLLADVGGRPLIERTVASLRDGGIGEVTLVVGPDDERLRRLAGVRVVVNEDPSRGMFSSIQAGVAALEPGAPRGGPDGDALAVLPGDMPFVSPATVRLLLARYGERPAIVSPRFGGKRGHPVILPPSLRDEILRAEPGANLHQVLRAHPDLRVDVDVDDRGVLRDVDTVSDLDA